jgi:uncharacterized delta-60 repeat protein
VLSLCAALVVLAVPATAASAEDATEAGTFGTDGIATQSLGVHYGTMGPASLVVRADGSLTAVQGGTASSYLPDGAPDPSRPSFPTPAEGRVFPAAGDKAFVLGYGKLTRLNPDGSADQSFGDNGTIAPPSGTQGVVELASGKILAVTVGFKGARDWRTYVGVSVLNPDSSIDAREVLARVVPTGSSIREIAPAPDGGALVIGPGFMLELGPDGRANEGFGEKGLLSVDGSLAGAHFLADGSIEAAGMSPVGSGKKREPSISRYTAAGKPDASFGNGGVRPVGLEGWTNVTAVSWAADGSLVLGGSAAVGVPCEGGEECEEVPVLADFDPAGNLEAGFGEGGVLRLSALPGAPQGHWANGVAALARRPDGSIVVAFNAPPRTTVAFLAALSPQGALLTSFGEGGTVQVRNPVPATQRVAGLAPVAGGGLLAAGWTNAGLQRHPVLARYGADGSLDRSFGDGTGFVSLAESGPGSELAVRGGEALVDYYGDPGEHLVLLRTGDGSRVSSFGSAGSVALPPELITKTLALAPDGDPVVLGFEGVLESKPPVVLRLGRDGRLDPAFGHGGRVTLRPPGGGQLRRPVLRATTGGRFLVGGFDERGFVVARLLPDGRLDPRFGSHGWAVTPLPGGDVDSVGMASGGSRIYLAGVVSGGSRPRVVLRRFRADGRLDRGFGHRGSRSVAVESSAELTAVLPTPHGVVVTVERGRRPVLTFPPDGAVRRGPVVEPPEAVWEVHAAVFGGRVIAGWSPLTGGFGNGTNFYLSVPAPG